MKILWSWLKDHLSVSASLEEVVHALTHSGTETEVTPAYSWTKGFQVAEVLSTTAHPKADNLRVCEVRLGHGQVVSIVCGAKNVRGGLKTMVALPGCLLPGAAAPLSACLLRGVPSNGMLCSAKELSMEDLWGEGDGLVELPEGSTVGTPLRDFLPQEDVLLHLNATPNRGDLFSHRGVARELAALGMGVFKEKGTQGEPYGNVQHRSIQGEIWSTSSAYPAYPALPQGLRLETPGCFFFQLCRMEGIQQGSTPAWMKRRLVEISTKSHGPCVDITNYASEDNGQPLHAFDAQAVQGDLHIRASKQGESLEALDGETYVLPEGAVVICDEVGILSLAGIMGGMRGRCQGDTTTILLESACFDPAVIARGGRLTALNSASRGRFERGVDPAFASEALLRAASWVSEHTGGNISSLGQIGAIPQAKSIAFNPREVYERCGVALPRSTIISRLKAWGAVVEEGREASESSKNTLGKEDGMEIGEGEEGFNGLSGTLPRTGQGIPEDSRPKDEERWSLTPPSWRWDWRDSWDCVTEILRGQGYGEVPTTPLPAVTKVPSQEKYTGGALPPLDYDLVWRLRDFWIAQGLYEVVTWSFISATMAQPFFQGTQAQWEDLQVKNPISKECAVLRPSILPSLLSIQSHHYKYGLGFQPVFEIGPRFFGLTPSDQRESLSALWPVKKSAAWNPAQPEASQEWSFYEVKAMVEGCVGALGLEHTAWMPADLPWYHPGQCAQLVQNTPEGERVLAVMGKLHPRLKVSAFGAELYLDAWKRPQREPSYTLPPLQPVAKDLSFYMPKDALVGPVLQRIRSLGIPELEQLLVTDVFQDTRVTQVEKDKGEKEGKASLEVGAMESCTSLGEAGFDEKSGTRLETDVVGSEDSENPQRSHQGQRSLTLRCIFQPHKGPFSSEELHTLMHSVAQGAQEQGWILRGSLEDLVDKS